MLMLKVKTTDNQIVEIEEPVACMSATLKATLDEHDNKVEDLDPIPVKDITAATLALVLKWCRHHVNDPVDIYESDEESQGYGFQLIGHRYRWRRRFVVVPKWDQDFLSTDNSTLFNIVNAAHFLQIKKLLDMTCQTVANKLRNKTPEQLRQEFNLKYDRLAIQTTTRLNLIQLIILVRENEFSNRRLYSSHLISSHHHLT